jgi:transposase
MSRKNSYEERLEIVFKAEQGLSHRQIAREMKIHRNSVNGIVKKHQESGTVEDRERSGRPKISTAGDDRILIRTSLADRRLTAPQLREEWVQSTGVEASVSTVKSRLSAAGLRGCVATKTHF